MHESLEVGVGAPDKLEQRCAGRSARIGCSADELLSDRTTVRQASIVGAHQPMPQRGDRSQRGSRAALTRTALVRWCVAEAEQLTIDIFRS